MFQTCNFCLLTCTISAVCKISSYFLLSEVGKTFIKITTKYEKDISNIEPVGTFFLDLVKNQLWEEEGNFYFILLLYP